MNRLFTLKAFTLVLFLPVILAFTTSVSAQSKPQRPTQKGDGKANARPTPKTEEQLKKEEEERRLLEEAKNAEVISGVEEIQTNVVKVDAVVYNKKTGQILTGLKKENFAIFEDGVKKDISGFATPDAPITVTLVLEYSKWSELFGSASGGIFEPGIYETIRPVAQFLTRFIKPPDDYASVIAFDMRPTPITDFTNDPARIRQTIDLLVRNQPAFRENNMFDAVKFALIGGKSDAVVLEDSESRYAEYGGMVDIKAKRRAIILVASGIDTFSKTNYGEARKIVQEAGIPIYIISTGNMFYKRFEHRLDAMDSISGMPGRLSFLQAKNIMNTLAKESGGMHFEMTFEGEIPGYLNTINGLLRSQYNLTYDLEQKHQLGKKYKLEVKVDVDGDGVYEDKSLVVQHRPFVYNQTEKEKEKLKK